VAAVVDFDGTKGDILNRLGIVAICSVPSILLSWGFRVLSQLRFGFSKSARRQLLAFYNLLLAYCGLWMVFPWFRDGEQFMMFGISDIMIIVALLSIPIFATMFTNNNLAEQDAAPNGG
jgi:hypothetical protein